jgi:AI-2 transport protein TqsA
MADLKKESDWLTTISLATIAIFALGAMLIYARSVLIPFVLAVLIFLLVSPVLDFLVLKLRFKRPLAVLVTLLLVLVIISIVFILLSEAVQTIIATAGQYANSFANLIDIGLEKMNRWNVTPDITHINEIITDKIPGMVTGSFGTAFDIVSELFLVAIFVIFLLAGRHPELAWHGVYADIIAKIRRYIVTKTAVSTVTGILVWITLTAFGLDLAPVFGMLAFLLNFIPSIGSIIATLLPIPIAVAQFQGSPLMIVFVIAIPGAIQITIGNVIEPKIMGKGLDLHPIVILLALSFWGLIWGAVGMFLSVPITAMIRIVLMQFETLKPVGMLLAGKLPDSNQQKN